MNLIVCLDETGGMTFNKRRQSSDRVVRENMLRMIGDNNLYVNSYTAKQFTEDGKSKIIVEDDCLARAKQGDYVFVENISVSSYLSDIEQIIVYRWKRKYPADFFFDIELTPAEWELFLSEEFTGYSHECIEKEIYGHKIGE